jgi:predicted CXXCH cytochrome family protein
VDFRRARKLTLAGMLAGLACVSSASGAEGARNPLLPVIPEGQGSRCVEDTDFMRRNHMDLLKHQRDETVLKGVRTIQYSLNECLDCHVVYGSDEVAVTASNPSHFCRACHDDAAVSIDCFECHASRPETAEMSVHPQLGGIISGSASSGSQ